MLQNTLDTEPQPKYFDDLYLTSIVYDKRRNRVLERT